MTLPSIINWSLSLHKGLSDSPYWVLASDYQSYSLVYSCFEYVGLFHIDFAWILARTRVLSKDMLAHLHEKLAAAGVNVNHLTVTNQTGCNVFTWLLKWKLEMQMLDMSINCIPPQGNDTYLQSVCIKIHSWKNWVLLTLTTSMQIK